jgi:two-component system response regulator AtoC
MSTVLIVEDNPADRRRLAQMVARRGHDVVTAARLDKARAELESLQPQLIFAAVRLPDGSGIDLLHDFDDVPEVEIALTAAQPDVASAIAAVRMGALDYLPKPVRVADLQRVLEAGIDASTSPGESRPASTAAERGPTRLAEMVTVSPLMRRVFQRIKRVAPTDVTVLVVGESGTGKELIAGAVHRLSSRKEGPFLAINCGAIAPSVIESELFGHERGSFTGADRRHTGFFERATDGTLLLDEITEMSEDLQVKLLRVIETGKVLRVGGTTPVDASPRIIATTNREPDEAIADGRLRADLYYRLKAFQIRVPTLNERGPEEIEFFARHFVDELNRQHSGSKKITADAIEAISKHPWPGNVRELRNSIAAAYVLAVESIDADSLSLDVSRDKLAAAAGDGPGIQVALGASIAEAEEKLILATLDHLDGDKAEAAKTLGISLKTLYNRLKEYRRARRD